MKTFRQLFKEIGHKIRVAKKDEAEECAYVICAFPPGAFPADDVHTNCAHCHRPIVHRGHAPKKPRKICIICAGSLIDFSSANTHGLVSAKTKAEVMEFFAHDEAAIEILRKKFGFTEPSK